MDLIYFIAGLVILGFAGEATLRGAVGLAQRLNISPAMIGLTVVGLGTSLPELVVCVEAALDGKPDLAVGNIVGSNISNILLILGVGALMRGRKRGGQTNDAADPVRGPQLILSPGRATLNKRPHAAKAASKQSRASPVRCDARRRPRPKCKPKASKKRGVRHVRYVPTRSRPPRGAMSTVPPPSWSAIVRRSWPSHASRSCARAPAPSLTSSTTSS